MPKSGVAPPALPVPTALKSVSDRCHNYRHSLFNKPLTNTMCYFDIKIRILIIFFKTFFSKSNYVCNSLNQYSKQKWKRFNLEAGRLKVHIFWEGLLRVSIFMNFTQIEHTLLKILDVTRSAIFSKNLNNKSISTFYLSCALLCFSVWDIQIDCDFHKTW